MKQTAVTFLDHKQKGEKISMLTAYDYSTAKLVDQAGIDGILKAHGYERDGKMYRTDCHNEDTVALFCHMGVTFFLLSHLLNISPVNLIHGMFLAPSSVTVVTTEEVRKGEAYFRCQMVGDTSHLYAAGEPVSHMGYFAEILRETK